MFKNREVKDTTNLGLKFTLKQKSSKHQVINGYLKIYRLRSDISGAVKVL